MKVDKNYLRGPEIRAQLKRGELDLPSWIVNTLQFLSRDIPTGSWLELIYNTRNGPLPQFTPTLTGSEKQRLRKTSKSKTLPTRDIQRAKIILLAETGLGMSTIGFILKTDRDNVREWCKRFCKDGLEGLKDEPRTGAPRSIPKLQEMAIISYIIEEKARYGKAKKKMEGVVPPTSQLGEIPPFSRLSGKDIHWLLKRDFGEDAPALSSVYRVLKRLKLRPWHIKNWIHIRDPQFWEKGSRVLDLYSGIYLDTKLGDDEYILSADELTQLQVLQRIVTPPSPGHDRQVEFEYNRGGVLNMHAAQDVRSGVVHHRFVKNSNKEEFRRFVKMVMAQEPYASARRVFWVVDNGGCHHPSTFNDWLQEEFGGRVVAVHTPAHGSWLNQIELFFSKLVRKALTPRNSSSHEEMMSKITKFIEWENDKAKPVKWTYTKEKLEALLERLKEKGLYPPPAGPLEIRGIGNELRRRLLDTFGSVEGIRAASLEEIKAINGFGVELSTRVVELLQV